MSDFRDTLLGTLQRSFATRPSHMSPQIPINGPREVPASVKIPTSVLEAAKATGIEALPCKAFSPHDADPTAYLSAREDCWNKSVKDWFQAPPPATALILT